MAEVEMMGSRELSEWMVWDKMHPIEDPWLQTAVIWSTMRNCWLEQKQPSSPQDLIDMLRPKQPHDEIDEFRRRFEKLVALAKGRAEAQKKRAAKCVRVG